MAEKWHCSKDEVPMIEAEVLLSYLNITEVINGLKCPKCGVIYLDEETVVDKVVKAEQMLEEK
jgi:hypothetical protein